MRFKSPTPGTVIWKKCFALFPKKVGNCTIWLEIYYHCKIYETAIWDDSIKCYELDYLNDSPQVHEYLLSQTSLAKAMREE